MLHPCPAGEAGAGARLSSQSETDARCAANETGEGEIRRNVGASQDDGGQEWNQLTVSTTLRILTKGRGSAPLTPL